MKRHYAVALVIIMMSAAVGHAQQKQIQFGWNYFELDTTYMNMGNAVALFGNSMRSTLYHTGADTVTSKRFSNAVAGTGGQIIAISGGAVGAYSNSQRMRIEAFRDMILLRLRIRLQNITSRIIRRVIRGMTQYQREQYMSLLFNIGK